jgi:FHA domain
MKLKLFLEQTGQSWTIKPNREYIVGTSQDCDIFLSNINVVAARHLKFSFSQVSNTWHVIDLGSANGTLINNQLVTDYSITTPTRIAIAGGIILVATPELAAVPISSTDPHLQVAHKNSESNGQSSLQILSWDKFVDKQARGDIATRFHMITGFRNTPWVRAYGQTGFNAFDGYIIPNFKGSNQTVTTAIEEKLSHLRGSKGEYEGTNCFIANLTDAHITDSATQTFTGIEIFPISRGWGEDYRRFFVVSYHRVRTYLLVEKYGSDLFVSWITRFEPQPTALIMYLWLSLAFILTLLALSTQKIWIIILPLLIWWEIYIFVPYLMRGLGILPKKSNAILLTILTVVFPMMMFPAGLFLFFGL